MKIYKVIYVLSYSLKKVKKHLIKIKGFILSSCLREKELK